MSRLSYYYTMARRLHSLAAWPRLVNYAKYRALPRRARQPLARYTPQIGSLFLTERCNLACGYCAAARNMSSDPAACRRSEFDLARAEQVLDNPLFARCLLIDLQGGEPLLVADLDRIVAGITARGMLSNMSTNGLLLRQRLPDLVQAGITRVNLSFYEANRACVERDLASINRIYPVHMSLVLLRTQVEGQPDRLLQTVRFFREAGCSSIRFWMYRPLGLQPMPDEVIDDTNPAFREFRRRLDEACPDFCLWPPPIQTGTPRKRCVQLWQRIIVDGLGRVTVCCGSDRLLTGPASNLLTDDPELVLNHPLKVAMRAALIARESPPHPLCRHCNLLGEPGW